MIIDLKKFREAIFNILSAEEYGLNMKLYDKNGFKIISPESSAWMYIDKKDYILRFPDDSQENVYLYFWRNNDTADDTDMKDIMNRCKKEAAKYGVIVQLKNFKYKKPKKEFSKMVNKGAVTESAKLVINHGCRSDLISKVLNHYVDLSRIEGPEGETLYKGTINDDNYNLLKQYDKNISELKDALQRPINSGKAGNDTAVRDMRIEFNKLITLMHDLLKTKNFEDFVSKLRKAENELYMVEYINVKHNLKLFENKNITKFEEKLISIIDKKF